MTVVIKHRCHNRNVTNKNYLNVPEAIPLQPAAAQDQGTSRSGLPLGEQSRDSTPCPCWRMRRSGCQEAGRTAFPAGLNTGHLECRAQRAETALTFISGAAVMEKFLRRWPNICSCWEWLILTTAVYYWQPSIRGYDGSKQWMDKRDIYD